MLWLNEFPRSDSDLCFRGFARLPSSCSRNYLGYIRYGMGTDVSAGVANPGPWPGFAVERGGLADIGAG